MGGNKLQAGKEVIMEQPVKKKKKHWGLRILCLLLVAALIAAVVLGIRIIPIARRLQGALTEQNCTITAQAEINQSRLTADQQKFLGTLSRLMGIEETEWNRVTLQGGYDDEAIWLAVCGGQGDRLTELYLTQDCQALDIHVIYDRAYAHLTEKVGLLALVLPQWSFGDYISLQQLEYAFGLQLGELPDIQGKLEQFQSKLSLPLLCGAVLAADQWDRDSQKLVYHITATDKRLDLARWLAKKAGHSDLADLWQLPEGMELDVVIDLGEPQVKTMVTGYVPGMEQLRNWSVELIWGAYVPSEQEIGLMDQGILDDFAQLLEALKSLQKQ